MLSADFYKYQPNEKLLNDPRLTWMIHKYEGYLLLETNVLYHKGSHFDHKVVSKLNS